MILTEEEAKTKRCQEGFPGQPFGSGYMEARSTMNPIHSSGYATATTPTHCIASACMAWRAVDPVYVECMTDCGQVPPDNGGEPWKQIENKTAAPGLRWRRLKTAGGGYCGKAGKP